LKWKIEEDFGQFVRLYKFDTQFDTPCSCAIFTTNHLIVGCDKFLQIDLQTYVVDGKYTKKIIYIYYIILKLVSNVS